jgi:hypothetical protein
LAEGAVANAAIENQVSAFQFEVPEFGEFEFLGGKRLGEQRKIAEEPATNHWEFHAGRHANTQGMILELGSCEQPLRKSARFWP